MKKITRSENMKRIKSRDTSIEIIFRKALWKKGYRYRKNCRDVIGKPDLCFKGKKLAVFCDSEFWHGKYLLEGKYIPKTNRKFWIEKLERNIERDKFVNMKLKEKDWTVLRFWESDIRKNTDKCVEIFEKTYNQL
ncbi:very short patch repair endonuclease [Sulfurimonas sp. ST-27]|uniref:very short patch repair endonuclease n=1 Tax=Sulfurimonas sp. ST-27 TaxID=3400152 RepID=UPI003AB6B38B